MTADPGLGRIVTFRSSAFNTTDPKPYYINPCCYGDDLADWLLGELRRRGIPVADAPGQEDFGWYLRFTWEDRAYACVIGYQPGDEYDEGEWIGWLERDCGFITSLLGGRKRCIDPGAARLLHAVLIESDLIREVRWHTEADFASGPAERGRPEP